MISFLFKAWWSVWKLLFPTIEVGNLSWKQKRILLKNGNIWECILGNNRFVSKYFQFILLARWLKIMSHHNDWRGSYLKYTALAKNKRSQKVRFYVLLGENCHSTKTKRPKRCLADLAVDRVLFINGHILLVKTVYFVRSYNFPSNADDYLFTSPSRAFKIDSSKASDWRSSFAPPWNFLRTRLRLNQNFFDL